MSVVRKNEKAKRFKRITLASLVIFGLLGSSIAFYQCVREYLSFEIHTEQKFVEVREQPFPTVTLCLNSMHSKKKIREYYPELEYILDLLYFNTQMNEETLQEIKSGHLAGNSDWRNYDEVIIVEELLRSTTMWDFVNKTSSHFMVSACRAGSVDCSERTGVWKDDYFEQGRCKSFSGSSARYLDLIMIYNRTDWTVGWSSFYDGITLYYSENTYKNDATSKAMIFNRMITNPTNAAVIGLSKTKNAKLGKPYSQCVKNGTLKYSSAEYTMDSCLHECKVDKIVKTCGCRAPFFRKYEGLYSYPDCTVFDHIFCVKEIMQIISDNRRWFFDLLMHFTCSLLQQPITVQYGSPTVAITLPKDISVTTFDIIMSSNIETIREKPLYPFERFMLDIGEIIFFFFGFLAIIFLFGKTRQNQQFNREDGELESTRESSE